MPCRGLLSARDKRLTVVVDHTSRRIAATSARLIEIEEMMTEADGVYWHSPALQAEYKALLEGADQQVVALDRQQQPALSPEAVAAINQFNDVGGRMDRAIGDALPGVDQAVMGLSDTLQVAMAREMAQGLPTEVEAADWEELTAFCETEHGKILSSWWGRDTDYKLGIALDRVARLEDQLGEEDKEAWIDFLHNRLSLEEVCAVLNEIVQ